MSLMLSLAVAPYIVPTVVAAYRDHPEKTPIFLINLFFGWTVIGWIVALVWACSGTPNVQPVATSGDRVGPGGLRLQGGDPRFDKTSGSSGQS